MRCYRDLVGPSVVAHRGGAGLAPENTLSAFALAGALGVDVLETDVRVTADGVAVAFHDEQLGRVTDLVGPVAATTWDRLRRAPRLRGRRVGRVAVGGAGPAGRPRAAAQGGRRGRDAGSGRVRLDGR